MITVQNPEGLGIIDIVSDSFLYCLKIDRIVAADSYDHGGTIAHYYELAGFNRKDIAAIAGRMNVQLINGSAAAVEEQIREFLLLFAPGTYEIELDQTTASYDFASSNYYPSEELFINLTQHAKYLDEKRIDFYMRTINNGQHPRLILFNKSWRHFIAKEPENNAYYNDDSFHFLLDGHHKLMAYHRLKQPIHYVLIRGFFPDTLSPACNAALFLDALPGLSPHFRDFLLLENMQVVTDTGDVSRQYNALLDKAFADAEKPGMGLMQKLKTLCENGSADEKNWAVARLDALYQSFSPGCKPRTFYYPGAGHKSWEELSCSSREAFDNWCVRYFGMRYPNYRTRILFGR